MGTQQRGTGHQNPPLNSLIVKESESFIKKKTDMEKPKSSVMIETEKKSVHVKEQLEQSILNCS